MARRWWAPVVVNLSGVATRHARVTMVTSELLGTRRFHRSSEVNVKVVHVIFLWILSFKRFVF